MNFRKKITRQEKDFSSNKFSVTQASFNNARSVIVFFNITSSKQILVHNDHLGRESFDLSVQKRLEIIKLEHLKKKH